MQTAHTDLPELFLYVKHIISLTWLHFSGAKKEKKKKKVLELMKVILIFCRQPFLFFLPNPNMAKLTARQNTTELLIMTADSVNLIIRKQK